MSIGIKDLADLLDDIRWFVHQDRQTQRNPQEIKKHMLKSGVNAKDHKKA